MSQFRLKIVKLNLNIGTSWYTISEAEKGVPKYVHPMQLQCSNPFGSDFT